MAHPLIELQTVLTTKAAVAGIVQEIMPADKTAKVSTSQGVKVVPYDIPISIGDQITLTNGRIQSNLTMNGAGNIYYV